MPSKPKHAIPRLKTAKGGQRNYSVDSSWKQIKGQKLKFQGVTVFAPTDPYPAKERKEFRTAMDNPYAYRAARIQTTFTVGDGYTTQILPRSEEDLPSEQIEAFEKTTTLPVPYWDNQSYSAEQIKDWVDKLVKDMDLQTNIFNAEFLAIEQGRCVLAITPLDKDKETKKWQMPEQIRLIRPEFTMRPLLTDETGELKGVQCTGVASEDNGNVIPAERCIYITHGFNNELYSDFYGDSKIARISDIANTLNIIFNNDYPNAAKRTWRKPNVWGVPIPPQDYGKEEEILGTFINDIHNEDGSDVAVTGASNKEETGVQLLGSGGDHGDISSLEMIRTGLIKAIITAFGIPGFMLSEGDFGTLGGNANLSEIDSYLNTEIKQQRADREKTIETQLYDRILMILFDKEDADELPVRITHKFNKPKIWTLLSTEMFTVFERMLQDGLIDEAGVRDVLGLEEVDKETMSTGSDVTPSSGWANNKWNRPTTNVNIGWGGDISMSNPWGTMPKGWGEKLGNNGTISTWNGDTGGNWGKKLSKWGRKK